MNDQTKTYVKWGVVIVVAAIAIVAALTAGNQPPGSMAVTVPAAVNLAIGIGILFLLTLAFGWIFQMFGLDLRGLADPLALAISAFIVTELQNIVNIIPAQYDVFVNVLFYALTLILAPIGAIRLWKGRTGDTSRLL